MIPETKTFLALGILLQKTDSETTFKSLKQTNELIPSLIPPLMKRSQVEAKISIVFLSFVKGEKTFKADTKVHNMLTLISSVFTKS